MKRLIFSLLTIVPALTYAQQDEQFTQFMHNRIFYNPGVAGTEDHICVNFLHRTQWAGFEGAPVTQNLNVTLPIKKLHGGVSLTLINEEIGFFSNFGAAVGYSYNQNLGNGVLGLGVNFSFRNQSTDASGWIPADINRTIGPGIPAIDAALISTDASGGLVDFNFGAYYKTPTWWGGVSATRLIEANTTVDAENIPGGGAASFGNFRHIYVMGGYNWAIPRSNWELQPSLLMKVSNASPTYDINVTGVYNKKIWGGVTYRNEDAIAALLGYQFTESLKAGYSYDIGASDLASSASGSHEIMVRYCFKINIEPKEIQQNNNVRFL